jgi:hypothetical protein
VKPVSLPLVEATLPQLPAAVSDMVRVQQLSDCRPQGVVTGRRTRTVPRAGVTCLRGLVKVAIAVPLNQGLPGPGYSP